MGDFTNILQNHYANFTCYRYIHRSRLIYVYRYVPWKRGVIQEKVDLKGIKKMRESDNLTDLLHRKNVTNENWNIYSKIESVGNACLKDNLEVEIIVFKKLVKKTI